MKRLQRYKGHIRNICSIFVTEGHSYLYDTSLLYLEQKGAWEKLEYDFLNTVSFSKNHHFCYLT